MVKKPSTNPNSDITSSMKPQQDDTLDSRDALIHIQNELKETNLKVKEYLKSVKLKTISDKDKRRPKRIKIRTLEDRKRVLKSVKSMMEETRIRSRTLNTRIFTTHLLDGEGSSKIPVADREKLHNDRIKALEEELMAAKTELKELKKEKGAAPTTNISTIEIPKKRRAAEFGPDKNLLPGRGLDIGTMNIVRAMRDKEEKTLVRLQRNAFFEVKSDDVTKNLIRRMGIRYAIEKKRIYIVGDSSFEVAEVFNKDIKRPMRFGLVNPKERDALLILKILIEKVVGPSMAKDDACYVAVPAEPIDLDMDTVYHRNMISGILKGLGYIPKMVEEGHAVVLSELANDDFTGIGISCGGGMFNICVSYLSMPVLSFSTSRGGDWIDEHASKSLGLPAPMITKIKEDGANLISPNSREEGAIAVYYRNLINYVLSKIRDKLTESNQTPDFPRPIDIVLSGGTSLARGFIEVFKEEFEKIDFPLKIKDIRRAAEPLYSVAKGCLVAASVEE